MLPRSDSLVSVMNIAMCKERRKGVASGRKVIFLVKVLRMVCDSVKKEMVRILMQ